jgi:hypothetical protein
MKHVQHTGTFTAYSETGREYAIHIYTEFDDARTHEDPYGVVAGVQTFRTPEGLEVYRRAKGEYQVAQTGVILRSDAPDAP